MPDTEGRRQRSLEQLPPWSFESLAGLAAIASFYTSDLAGLRLALQLFVMVIVGLGLFRDRDMPLGFPSVRTARAFPLYLIAMAFFGMYVSFVTSLFRGLSLNDVGLFLLQGGVAAMIFFSRRRANLAVAVGNWAVVFAIMDLLANLLGVVGVLDTMAPARQIDGVVIYSYPGLTGSTLSSGFVAFAAVCRLAFLARQPGKIRWVACLIILLLIVSLNLIGARRYLGLALASIMLFLFWKPLVRIGLHWVAVCVGSIFLWLTFNAGAGDAGNLLRSRLLLNGVERASEHLVVGRGPTYFDLTNRNATYSDLSEAGVTESQVLDLSVSYGVLPVICLLIAVMFALGHQEIKGHKYHAIALTCLSAELFFGGVLSSFAGTLLFYGALGACLEALPRQRHPIPPVHNGSRIVAT